MTRPVRNMKGLSRDNLFRMRQFYVGCRRTDTWLSGERVQEGRIVGTLSRLSGLRSAGLKTVGTASRQSQLIRMKEASGRLADLADAEQLRLTLKVDEPVELQPGGIDWRLTTWDGSRREQLRRWAELPLENAVAALEEMEEITERFREMREFHTAGSGSSAANETFGPRGERPQ